jgi:RNA polymerase sigma factor (TIGR02999 family)
MPSGEITQLLNRMASETGDARKKSYDQLISLAYYDLKRRAAAALRGNENCTRPTGLVHELYGKLSAYRMDFNDREHFFNTAAKEMRRLIIQDARRRKAEKRGGGQYHTTLDEGSALFAYMNDPELLIDVDRAVEGLPADQVRFIEVYWYAGFTMDQAAEILGLTLDGAKYRWELIKRKIARKLGPRHGADSRSTEAV